MVFTIFSGRLRNNSMKKLLSGLLAGDVRAASGTAIFGSALVIRWSL